MLHKNDKDAHVHISIISSNVLHADPVQELSASFDLTREDAVPLASALDTTCDLTRRGANDAKVVSVE